MALFLAELTERQIRVGAAYFDGLTQAEIAEDLDVTQQTVSRDLEALRRLCQRFGISLPKPARIHAADEVQMSERLYKSL